MAKLLYSHEQIIPFDKEREEPTSESTQENIDKDFKIFYQADSKDPPEPSHRLLSLLTSAPARKLITFLKPWCLRKKCPTCWLSFLFMPGGMLSQYQSSPNLLLLLFLILLPQKQLRRKGKGGNRPEKKVSRRGRYPRPLNSRPPRS